MAKSENKSRNCDDLLDLLIWCFGEVNSSLGGFKWSSMQVMATLGSVKRQNATLWRSFRFDAGSEKVNSALETVQLSLTETHHVPLCLHQAIKPKYKNPSQKSLIASQNDGAFGRNYNSQGMTPMYIRQFIDIFCCLMV